MPRHGYKLSTRILVIYNIGKLGNYFTNCILILIVENAVIMISILFIIAVYNKSNQIIDLDILQMGYRFTYIAQLV